MSNKQEYKTKYYYVDNNHSENNCGSGSCGIDITGNSNVCVGVYDIKYYGITFKTSEGFPVTTSINYLLDLLTSVVYEWDEINGWVIIMPQPTGKWYYYNIITLQIYEVNQQVHCHPKNIGQNLKLNSQVLDSNTGKVYELHCSTSTLYKNVWDELVQLEFGGGGTGATGTFQADHGEIYLPDLSALSLMVNTTHTQITPVPGIILAGLLQNVTFTDAIAGLKPVGLINTSVGRYLISYTLSLKCVTGAGLALFASIIYINGVKQQKLESTITYSPGITYNISNSGIIYLDANSLVELRLSSSSVRLVTIAELNMNIVKIFN